MTEADNYTLTEIASPLGFEATLARVTDAIEAGGLTMFARIDHAANAHDAGLQMPRATVLIYGNAKGGTPLMLMTPNVALDLPLRVLVREAESGAVVAFHPIAPILLRAGVPQSAAHKLDAAQRILEEAVKA